ncbi:MAG: class I SAM-dependent RNA methyltransferase [Gemmatimonadaceae bacterium]
MSAPLKCFAIAAPGLEPLLEAELRELSIKCKAVTGGVEWAGSESSVAIANLWSRLASRVVVRIGEFRARSFFELERHAKKVEWDKYLAPGAQVQFRVTARKSKLYHTGAIEQRLQEAIARKVGRDIVIAGGSDDEDDTAANAQLFVVRFERDAAVISADTSGELLHRRGYRQAIAKAPLRETLAAAMLRGAEWTGKTPLVDPMCGSGTIPIEAAMIARKIAPGLDRSFAFLGWPGADVTRWKSLVEHARSQVLAKSPVAIAGSDRDAGAIEASRSNAERAGVTDDIQFAVKAISGAVPVGTGPGLLIMNPPYGERIGESDAIRNLYAQAGNVARGNFDGWTFAMLSPNKVLEGQTRLALEEQFKTSNGGIPVRLVAGPIE